jgi:hypothetical protein
LSNATRPAGRFRGDANLAVAAGDEAHSKRRIPEVTRSNVWEWDARRLLQWHREKAGSIEAVHDVLKNELAAGVLPCSRFGANAAWLRLAVISHNVLTALKRLALPPELLNARPKRLRFLIFNTAGRLVHHARRMLCRIAAIGWRDWRHLIPLPAR